MDILDIAIVVSVQKTNFPEKSKNSYFYLFYSFNFQCANQLRVWKTSRDNFLNMHLTWVLVLHKQSC